MAFEEAGRELFVAGQGVEARAGRAVPEHVRVIRQQPVGDAAGRHLARRVRDLLVVMFVDVAPPGLGVPDEIHGGKFIQGSVKAREAPVVVGLQEVQQHRHREVPRHLGDTFDVDRIAVHAEFLFADSPRAEFQIFFQFRPGLWQVGHFVGEKQELLWMRLGKLDHRLVAETFRLQTVCLALQCGGPIHR